jgi:hypothetical protein
MGISNLHAGLENEIACHRGELDELRKQIADAKELIERLPEMLERAARLEEIIEAAEKLIKFRKPDWQSDSVKPKRRTAHNNPIPFGGISLTMLTVLREASAPMRTRDIAREILRRHGVPEPDRKLLDRVANSTGNSLNDHEERGIVRSIRNNVYEWEVIR